MSFTKLLVAGEPYWLVLGLKLDSIKLLIWFMSEITLVSLALVLEGPRATRITAERSPIIAITTSISIKVKPSFALNICFFIHRPFVLIISYSRYLQSFASLAITLECLG